MPHRPDRPLQNTPGHALRCTRRASAHAATRRTGRWCRACSPRCSSSSSLVSLALVLRFLATGEGYAAATVSIVVKTCVLYTIMVTGAIWEQDVFGRYLFAPAFFWEDVVSIARARAAHRLSGGAARPARSTPRQQMLLALAAYADLRRQRRAVPAEAARRAARRRATPRRAAIGADEVRRVSDVHAADSPRASTRLRRAPRSCASAASARSSAA